MKFHYEKRIKSEGIEVLNGLYITYKDLAYDGEEKKAWIGGCPLSNHIKNKESLKGNIEYIKIQCDDKFKGNRGTNISFEQITKIHKEIPLGYKPITIHDIGCCAMV